MEKVWKIFKLLLKSHSTLLPIFATIPLHVCEQLLRHLYEIAVETQAKYYITYSNHKLSFSKLVTTSYFDSMDHCYNKPFEQGECMKRKLFFYDHAVISWILSWPYFIFGFGTIVWTICQLCNHIDLYSLQLFSYFHTFQNK